MGITRTLFYTTGFVSFGGYFILHRELNRLYPNIPLYELPKNTRIGELFNKKSKDPSKTVPSCDTYKIRVQTPLGIQELTDEFLTVPPLAKLIVKNSNSNSNSNLSKSSMVETEIEDSKFKKNQYESTLLKWRFTKPWIVPFFEKLATYGYPWRLMNGGFHEVYVEKDQKTDGFYDVYFASAHEYNNWRDGKLIPSWVQVLHQDYAKILLHLAFSKYSP